MYAWITGDEALQQHIRRTTVEACRQPSWSGRPDPLLMGGDNDRGVGLALYNAGMVWEFQGHLFSEDERAVVLAKVDEYLQKMYDFTLLQRAYMGCPTTDAHSIGAWYGVGIACMCFYDDLAIARKALPFFHGLFVDSLKLFPPGRQSQLDHLLSVIPGALPGGRSYLRRAPPRAG